MELAGWLRQVIALEPTSPALQFEGHWYPWAYLADAADALDRVGTTHGLGPGATVGVVLRNQPSTLRAAVAVLATNRCLVSLNPSLPAASLAEDVVRLGLAAVVATDDDWHIGGLTEAAERSGALILTTSDDALSIRSAGSAATDRVRPGVAVQIATSGTTGPPKRVDLQYRSLAIELEAAMVTYEGGVERGPRLSSGTAVLWNPLVHVGGLRALLSNLVAGRRLALLERFDVDRWAALVREHQPRALSLVPAAMRMVLDADVPPEALASAKVVISGTAPVPPELAEQFEDRYGIPVLVVYGATEFAGGVAGWTLPDKQRFGRTKRGSVGRANPGVELRVVDVEGSVQANGSEGLLEVRSAQLAQPGWLRTNDLAVLDDDGFVWINGRADDVIIRGGLKMSAGTIRDALLTHPSVADACVVALPDERLGQVPVAAVECVPGAVAPAPEQLRDHLRSRLSAYQIPVRILVVDELPRTSSMKVSQYQVALMLSAS